MGHKGCAPGAVVLLTAAGTALGQVVCASFVPAAPWCQPQGSKVGLLGQLGSTVAVLRFYVQAECTGPVGLP